MSHRFTVSPLRRRKAIWSPLGENVGAKLLPSFVSRTISAPLRGSMITMSRPLPSVRSATMTLPSGDQEGFA